MLSYKCVVVIGYKRTVLVYASSYDVIVMIAVVVTCDNDNVVLRYVLTVL